MELKFTFHNLDNESHFFLTTLVTFFIMLFPLWVWGLLFKKILLIYLR